MNCDTIYCILSYLPFDEVLKCGLVNHQFAISSQNELIWKRLSRKDYENLINNNHRISYKSYYKLDKFLCLYQRDVLKIEHELSLFCANITNLPDEIYLLTELRFLHLSGNELSLLPTVISSLTNLQELDLAYNNFEIVPREVLALTNLRVLSLNGNKLTNISEELCMLKNLNQLYLQRNKLLKLPDGISELTNLVRMDIEYNKFDSLPLGMTALTKLERIYADSTQLNLFDSGLMPKVIH
jgi:Leucine-rich repeat (LRR) protein